MLATEWLSSEQDWWAKARCFGHVYIFAWLELPDGKTKGLTARSIHRISIVIILEVASGTGCYAVLDKLGQAGDGNPVRG